MICGEGGASSPTYVANQGSLVTWKLAREASAAAPGRTRAGDFLRSVRPSARREFPSTKARIGAYPTAIIGAPSTSFDGGQAGSPGCSAFVGQADREEKPGGTEFRGGQAVVRRMPEPGRPHSHRAQMAARYQYGEAAGAIDDARGKVRFTGPPQVSESPLDATSIARNAEDVTVSFGEFCGMRGKWYRFSPQRRRAAYRVSLRPPRLRGEKQGGREFS